MMFSDGVLSLEKSVITSLCAVRSVRKGAPLFGRLWCWDLPRTTLYVVGESMVVRAVWDIVEFAERPPDPFFFDVEELRGSVLPHVRRGCHIELRRDDESLRACVVQTGVGEAPPEDLCSMRLEQQYGPLLRYLDGAFPEYVDRIDGLETTSMFYMHHQHTDVFAKLSKALKSTSVRIQAGLSRTDPFRADFAVEEAQGRWSAVCMPVRHE